MRFWRSIGLSALALAILSLPARAQDSTAVAKKPASHRSSVPERRAWVIGFHYGVGSARFVGSDQTVTAELRSDTEVEYPPLVAGKPDWAGTDTESGSSYRFRLGYAVNPKWTVGFENSHWSKDFTDYKWSFALSLMTATWYPHAGHVYLRGGAGLATVTEKLLPYTPGTGPSVTTLAPNLDFAAPFFVQYQDHGFAFDLAAGYEYAISKRVSIAPELSLRSMAFDQRIRAQIGTGTVSFNWWF